MIYKIEHCVDPDRPAFISSDYGLVTMEYLIAYIENMFLVVAPDLGLTPNQMAVILRDVYKCEIIPPPDGAHAAVLDAYAIETRLSPGRCRIRVIRMFEKEGLHDALMKAVREIEISDGDNAWMTLRVVAGGHGSVCGNDPYGTGFEYCYGKIGARWDEVICKPEAKPDPGYEVEGWYSEGGTRLEDDTRITHTQLVTVRFRDAGKAA